MVRATLWQFVLVLGILASGAQASPQVDFWAETLQLFGSAPAEQDLRLHRGAAPGDRKANAAFSLDRADKRMGDFSVLFTKARAANHNVVGFTPGLYQQTWPIGRQWTLHLWLKATDMAAEPQVMLSMVLRDRAGRRAERKLAGFPADGEWHELQLPLERFTASSGFDFDQISICQLETKLADKAKIWFDGVYFVNPAGDEVLGVTDKTIDQRMAEAEANRPQREKQAFEHAAEHGIEMWFMRHFAKLWLGQDLEEVNADLLRIFTSEDRSIRDTYGLDDHWGLSLNNILCKMYYWFGDKSTKMPGRLKPDTQKALLELLWERTKKKNDIFLARQSTWWMTGSENHDLSCKMACFVSSQIFKNEPDFAKRIYPDLGTGGGTGYWFHTPRLHKIKGMSFYGPEGRAKLTDGKKYNAQDHYEQWVRYFMDYFAERARRGFFLETHSPTYMKYTTSFIISIYDYSEDQALREQAGKFMDLIFANWAQDQFDGVRGGAKTRVKAGGYANEGSRDSYYELAAFLLGGSGGPVAGSPMNTMVTSDYRLPKVVWSLALDREGLGSFAFLSRKPGEEQNVWPRPLGLERTMMCDTHSRFLRYSWVTPDYILGTQMDHPAAVHSHLSCQARWQGITFNTGTNMRIFPRDVIEEKEGKWKMGLESFYRSAQWRTVLVTQQARGWSQVNPEWFPKKDMASRDFGIYFSTGLDRVEEKAGWIFVQEGNTYVAIKVIRDRKVDPEHAERYIASKALYAELDDDAYEWNRERRIIRFKDKYSPIIFETARKADYATLEDFTADILDNPLLLHNTVVPEWYVVSYTGCGANAKEIIFNAANNEMPTVGGEYIDYAPAKVYDSPYLQSDYNSGVITVQKGTDKLVLDFN